MARRHPLTDKQRLFVAEYLKDLNATRAYREVYQVSQQVAENGGCRLLSNAKVADAIQQAVQARIRRTEITADRVLREYARIAFADMRQFATWGPAGLVLNASDDLSADDAAAVAEVSQTVTAEGGSLRVKLHAKQGSLDSLAKHTGVSKDDIADALRELGGGFGALLKAQDHADRG